jgi:hypothetical protein
MITQLGSIHVPAAVVVLVIDSAGLTFVAVRPGPLIVNVTAVAAGNPVMIHRPVCVHVPGTGTVAAGVPTGGDGQIAVPTTGPPAPPVVAVMVIPPTP